MRRLPSAPPLRNSRSPWPAVLLLSPALLFVVVFIAFPLGSEVWFSLSNAQVGEIGSFVGLSNFVSPSLWRASFADAESSTR